MIYKEVAEIQPEAEQMLEYVRNAISHYSLNKDARKEHGTEHCDKYAIHLCKVRDALYALRKAVAETIDFIAPA